MRPDLISMRIADRPRTFPSVPRGDLWELNSALRGDSNRQIVQFFIRLIGPTIEDAGERAAGEREIRAYYGLQSSAGEALADSDFDYEHCQRISRDFLTFMRRQRGSTT